MKKRLITLLCALAMMTNPAWAAENGSAYSDVAGDEWFAPAVHEMTRLGVMTGVEDGAFAPYQVVTRATVILVLWRLEGSPEATVEEPFPDTEDWFETAAAWAKGTGIASGYGDGTFGGQNAVTREQLAVFLYNYAKYKGDTVAEGVLGLFSDVSAISPWAEEAMRHAVGAGILQGNDVGTIEPQGVANRAALAVMLQRMLIPAAG